MPYKEIFELTKAVNETARLQYPALQRRLGNGGLLASYATRLSLRNNSPYPYALYEGETFYPSTSQSFGKVINAERNEGLEAIHNEISTKQKEHQWLYVPAISKWIDTTVSADSTSVWSDQYIQIYLTHLFGDVESVHTHPDKAIQSIAPIHPWQFSHNYLMEAAIPSSNDLLHHSMMRARSAMSSKLISSVVSHYGVTSFSTIEAGALTGYFTTSNYDKHIQATNNPTTAIHHALGALSAHTLLYDDSPAFNFSFEPL